MFIDFKIAKKLCTMEQLLARYNVRLRIIGGDTLRGKCPLPTHSSNNSGDSFSVSRNKNVWSCKSQSCINTSGRAGGNVLDFVATMEQCGLPEAAAKLVEWFGPANEKPPLPVGRSGEVSTSHPTLGAEKEKTPAHMEQGPDVSMENTPRSHSDNKPVAAEVKAKGYMKEVDEWWAKLIERGDQEEDADYWKRVLNGVKQKLLESFRNGRVAGQSAPKAA